MNSNNLNIAFILPSFDGGGAERVIVNLANGFTNSGLFVSIIVLNSHGSYINEANNKVKIINLNKKRTLYSYFSLLKFVRDSKPNVLFSTMPHINILALFIKIVYKKYTVVIRESNTTSEQSKSKTSVKWHIIKLLRRVLYNKADLIVCPSAGVAEDLLHHEKLFLKHIQLVVIPNPCNYNSLLIRSTEPIKDEFMLRNNNTKFIIGIGALSKQKDFSTLIKAFSIIDKRIDCKLIILGDGSERDNLESLVSSLGIQEKVYMPGFVDNPFNYLISSDVFVLSSIYEGLPNALIQALLLDVPCISTNCKSGPNEILANGDYGQLVKIGDPISMSKAIYNVLSGKWVRGKNIDKSKYFVEETVSRYLSLRAFKFIRV